METTTEKKQKKALKLAKDIYFSGGSLGDIKEIGELLIEISNKTLENKENTISAISNGSLKFYNFDNK